MKYSTYITSLAFGVLLATVAGCGITEYDNYEKPNSTLEGAVVHEGDTIRVRNGAVQLEIWEDGYKDYEKIPVRVNQDGSFSSKLFGGSYKITELIGDGPWVPSSDTTEFEISGNKQMAFEVEPYYKITDENISLQDNAIVADFDLAEVNTSQPITYVTLFVGTGQFTSIQNNSFFWNHLQEEIEINTNGSNTIDVDLSQLPEELSSREFVYARICVEIEGKEDAMYSKSYKLKL